MNLVNCRGIMVMSFCICIWGFFCVPHSRSESIAAARERKTQSFQEYLVSEGYSPEHAADIIHQSIEKPVKNKEEFAEVFKTVSVDHGFFMYTDMMAAYNQKICINTARIEELCLLPGVGAVLAGRIIEYRKENIFKSPDDLLQVKGIGISKLTRIREFITVNTKEEKDE